MACILLPMTVHAHAQEFMMQGWKWNYLQFLEGGGYLEYLENHAEELAEAGFTYLWLPPLAEGSSGVASMGYDVKDYYNLGEYTSCRWGTRDELDALIATLNSHDIKAVADMVYNHRDGGSWEDNPSVEGWIENMNATKIAAGDQPFPSDRYRCYLPLGGASGNGAGTYYFKIHSASGSGGFVGKPYTVMMWTNTVDANYGLAATAESEPNGGADCGEANDVITLGKRFDAAVDGGCGTDELALTLEASDFNADGDTLWIRMYNTGSGGLGDMTDHFIYGLWSGAAAEDIQDEIGYQTATNYGNVQSGQGYMDHTNFKPNGAPTQLAGDLDGMFFFYDVDQNVASSRDVLFDNTVWNWNEVGIRGFRVDAVKHFPADFMGDLLDHLHDNGIDPGMVVGEAYDFSAGYLNGWLNDVESNMDDDTKSAISVRVFDFALRNALEQASDAFGYDVRNVFNSGIVDGAGGSGFHTVTFVNNHDFRDPGQPVDNDPMLGYAYILTNNKLGIPCVYHPDYYEPLNLRYQINGLMEAHQRYIYGATQTDYLNRFSTPYASNYISGFPNTTLLYQLSYAESGREVIVVINYAGETLKLDHTINTANIFPGDTLTDIFAVTPYEYQIVSGDNQVYFEVPARSFAVFVEGDLRDELIDISTPEEPENVLDIPVALQVFPNPADGYVHIEHTFTSQPDIRISDLQGKNLELPVTFQSGQLILNTQTLSPGRYFIHLQDGERSYSASFTQL